GGTMLVDISASALDNTVNYNSSSAAQTIKTPIDSYFNLTLSGGGTNKTLSGNAAVLGNLAISGSASFRLSSFNVSVAGDWNNSSSNGAAFASGTGTVTLNGIAMQRIINTGHASGTRINRLTIANTSTTAPQINVLADVTVANTLNMTSGVINLNSKKFQLGTSNAAATTLNHSGAASSGWFYNGDFARYFVTNATIPNGSNDGFFSVGTSSNFRPFYLSSSTMLTSTPVATITCPPSTATYSKENIPDAAGEIVKLALSGWRIQLSNGTGGDFSVNAGGTGIGIIGDVSDLRLSQISSAAGAPGVNSGTPSSPLVQRTSLTAADMTDITFYVGSVNLTSSPLPVQLISFTGQVEGSTVNLQWQTSSELNCDHFTVYRSANGMDFIPVGSSRGSGTSHSSRSYELQDAHPMKGTNYYKLEQADYDGKKAVLSIISVEANGAQPISIYPNPVQTGQSIHIDVSGKSAFSNEVVSLYDIAGRQILNCMLITSEDGSFHGNIDLPLVPTGLYFLKIGNSLAKVLIN
ncbi:MAG: T9SS type A sorting domain-containing protein, partial [Cyclobacteriaceae bacterium]|nr:T9SS type A sorting domain-containing protein [Cyclobacteriaceae bacterium]